MEESGFSAGSCVEMKKVKLFGFELNPSKNEHESCSLKGCSESGDHESVNSSSRAKFECQYCFKEFTNSQALGGHQNAHKKERLKRKKMQIQARKASSLTYYLQPPWFYSEDQYSSSHISFNPKDQYSEFIHFDGSNSFLPDQQTRFFTLTQMDGPNKPVIFQSSASSPIPASKHSSNCKSLDLQLGLDFHSNMSSS